VKREVVHVLGDLAITEPERRVDVVHDRPAGLDERVVRAPVRRPVVI
jgi:hypothetical protein